MTKKRVKISFEELNKGKYRKIGGKDIAETFNCLLRSFMWVNNAYTKSYDYVKECISYGLP